MIDTVVSYGFQLACHGLAAGILVQLWRRGMLKRLTAVSSYLLALLFVDAAARRYVFLRYGYNSSTYFNFYWITDVLLALGAFLLVCALFRRACAREEKIWLILRLVLVFVFVIVLGISLFSLKRNFSHLFWIFIVEFQQNLYFTCLVLNTLLYIFMQQTDNADEELQLLVSGLGLQFAGPAANLALIYLTQTQHYATALLTYISPLCTVGMLATWYYAVSRHAAAEPAARPAFDRPAFAEADARQL